jgi:hypothetical protein
VKGNPYNSPGHTLEADGVAERARLVPAEFGAMEALVAVAAASVTLDVPFESCSCFKTSSGDGRSRGAEERSTGPVAKTSSNNTGCAQILAAKSKQKTKNKNAFLDPI